MIARGRSEGERPLHARKDANPPRIHSRTSSRRAEFWDHLYRSAREAYPRADTPTGGILEFGMVCKERHKDAPREAYQSARNHCPTHAVDHYLWRKIRHISAKRYGIQLNAVAHDTYTTMFLYLRRPTPKKPAHELDWAPFYTPCHPQGEELKELLTKGHRYQSVRDANASGKPSAGLAPVRSHVGIVFKWVTEHNLRKRKGAQKTRGGCRARVAGWSPAVDRLLQEAQGLLGGPA